MLMITKPVDQNVTIVSIIIAMDAILDIMFLEVLAIQTITTLGLLLSVLYSSSSVWVPCSTVLEEDKWLLMLDSDKLIITEMEELKSLPPHNQFYINHHHHKSQFINQIINHNNIKLHIKPHINHNNHKASISLNKNIFHKSQSQLFHNNNNKWTMLHHHQWFNNNNNSLMPLMKKLIKFWLCYNKDNMDMIC